MIPNHIKSNYLSQFNIEQEDFAILEKKGTYVFVKEKTLWSKKKNLQTKPF